MCTKEIDKVGARRLDWDRLAWEDGFARQIGRRLVNGCVRRIGRRLVNGCVRRKAGRVGIGGLVREEDELAMLACVNYQGTAFFVCITKCCF